MEHILLPVLDLEGTKVLTYETLEVERLPVAAGFKEIEGFLDNVRAEYADATWYFGNVYGTDGHVLNWWA